MTCPIQMKCPIHKTEMIYCEHNDRYACQDVQCKFASGITATALLSEAETSLFGESSPNVSPPVSNKPIVTRPGIDNWREFLVELLASEETVLKMHTLEGWCLLNTIDQQAELLTKVQSEVEAAPPLPADVVHVSRETYDKISDFLAVFNQQKLVEPGEVEASEKGVSDGATD